MANSEHRVRMLRLARGVVETMAPKVSVAFFAWFKAPGNEYMTFYPTDLLPAPGDSAEKDPSRAQALFSQVVDPAGNEPRPLTVGLYDREMSIPGWAAGGEQPKIWPPPKGSSGLPVLPRGSASTSNAEERRAIRRLLAQLDRDWLRAHGGPSPEVTRTVLQWIDDIIQALGASPHARWSMKFEQTAELVALRVAQVEDGLGGCEDIWWGRQPL